MLYTGLGALYGIDLHETTTPIEVVLGWPKGFDTRGTIQKCGLRGCRGGGNEFSAGYHWFSILTITSLQGQEQA